MRHAKMAAHDPSSTGVRRARSALRNIRLTRSATGRSVRRHFYGADQMTDTRSRDPDAVASAVQFLMALHFINWLGFAGWNALLHNYTIEAVGFGWFEAGLTQTVREIPGFLAFTVAFWLIIVREQVLGYVALILLGIGVAMTGSNPTLMGVLISTFVMSVGFHYFETVNTSLQLQLLPKAQAPSLIGRIISAGAAAQFIAYGSIAIVWWLGWRNYMVLYAIMGLSCAFLTVVAMLYFKRFEGPVRQRSGLVVRKRYGLYYALTFMSGARRQLFFAFGGFLLVKKFGYSVADMAVLMLVTSSSNTFFAPRLGRLVQAWGERNTIMLENAVLICVFIGYAMTSNAYLAAGLFIIDGIFFTLILAQKTYFQKIGDPADMAATASVAFTINHIAAVVIPVTFGLIGTVDYSIIFWLGAGIATTSLLLSFLVPLDPAPGRETVLAKPSAQPAE
jgi:predicted MFS family arabinose efflux permease